MAVGAGAPPAPDFTVEALPPPDRSAAGKPIVAATVRNTGGRALDVTGTLMLSRGPGGLSAGPFPAELDTTLAVGATELITIALDGRLPAGPWDAVVALESGVTERRGEATITFPASGEAAAVAIYVGSASQWLVVGGSAAALVAIGLLGMRVRRRAVLRSRPAPRHLRPRAEQASDLDINSTTTEALWLQVRALGVEESSMVMSRVKASHLELLRRELAVLEMARRMWSLGVGDERRRIELYRIERQLLGVRSQTSKVGHGLVT